MPKIVSVRSISICLAVTVLLVFSFIAAIPNIKFISSGDSVVTTTSTGCALFDSALNPTTNLVYLTDYNCGKLYVVNATTYAVMTSINVGFEPEGVAVNPVTNMIYVANSGDGTVSVINGATSAVTATIQLGNGTLPSNVAVDSKTNQVFVTYADNIAVINGSNNRLINVISDSGNPVGIAIDESTGMIYVSDSDTDSLSSINGTTYQITGTLKLGVSYGASGVTFNPTTDMIYVIGLGGLLPPPAMGLSNWLWVVNPSSNSLVASVQLENAPLFVSLNPLTDVIYVSTSNNTIVVVNGTTNTVMQNLTELAYRWNGISVDSATNKVYIAFGVADGASQGQPSGFGVLTSDLQKTTSTASLSSTQHSNDTSSSETTVMSSTSTNLQINTTSSNANSTTTPSGTISFTESLIAVAVIIGAVAVGLASFVVRKQK